MNRRNGRRGLAAASALAVTATLALTACSSEEPAPDDLAGNRVGAMDNYGVGVDFKATTDEPLEFSILINNHPGYPFDEDWPFWEWLEERTNVRFDFEPAPLSDFNTVRTTMITSGSFPDIVTRFYGNQENEFAGSGALLAVSDYTQLMPNYTQRVAAWNMQSDLDTHIQEDGKYYVLPGMHEEKRFEYSFAARTDLLEKYDIETPRTLDEFRDMLVTLKQECAGVANCYPMSDLYNNAPVEQPAGSLIKTIAAAHGVKAGWDYDTVTWNFETNQYELAASSEGYRKTLEYLNDLVSDGLLDPESFTQTDDQARQKLAQGRSFVVSSNMQGLVNNYRKDVGGISGAEMGLIPIPTGPFGERLFGGRLENGIALNAEVRDSENFVALMQFIDWLFYSDNGQEFAKWGVEGETFTKAGDGTRELLANIRMLGFNPDAPQQLQIDYGVFNGAFVYGGSVDIMRSFYTPEEAEFYGANVEGREILPLAPPAPLSEDEAVEAGLIRAPLMQHVMTESLRFILGQRPLREWDTFVDEVENGLDGKEYLDLVTAAQQRFADSRS